jgi:hypothetical protein
VADPGVRSATGLDHHVAGDHSTTVVTVDGAVGLAAEGDRVGEGPG